MYSREQLVIIGRCSGLYARDPMLYALVLLHGLEVSPSILVTRARYPGPDRWAPAARQSDWMVREAVVEGVAQVLERVQLRAATGRGDESMAEIQAAPAGDAVVGQGPVVGALAAAAAGSVGPVVVAQAADSDEALALRGRRIRLWRSSLGHHVQ